MALTVVINEDNINVSSGENVAYLTTDTTGKYKFRYYLKLTYNVSNDYSSAVSNTVTFTQQQNGQGAGVFNLSEVYKSIVTPQISGDKLHNYYATTTPTSYAPIHDLPIDNVSDQYAFSSGILSNANGYEAFHGMANVLNLEFYEMYSETETGIPVVQDGTGGTSDTKVEKTIFLVWGRAEYRDKVNLDILGGNYGIDGWSMNLVGQSGRFMTGNYNQTSTYVCEIDLAWSEFHTMAFFNRSAINTSAQPFYIEFEWFDSSDVSLGTMIVRNVSSTGGKYDNTLEDERFVLFIGTGLVNLNALDLSIYVTGTKPSAVSGGTFAIKSYTMKATTNTGTQMSMEYKFNVIEYCSRYESTRLAYVNRWGAWEYITLNKKKEEKLKVEKEFITKPLLNQSVTVTGTGDAYLDNAYPEQLAKQGEMSTSIKADETITLFTDNLKDYQIEQIRDMMMSPQIHEIGYTTSGSARCNARALILETKEMKLKGDKNLGLYNYELKFRYAAPQYKTT